MSGVLSRSWAGNIGCFRLRLGEISGQLLFAISPGEIGGRLGKSKFRQPAHNFGTCESFREENCVGLHVLYFAQAPLPKIERLGVWVVDTKNADPLRDPKQEDAFQFFPHRRPRFTFKIEWINVLIFFGRVLRILNGAVRSMTKPFRMLFRIRMVGRTLEGNV